MIKASVLINFIEHLVDEIDGEVYMDKEDNFYKNNILCSEIKKRLLELEKIRSK